VTRLPPLPHAEWDMDALAPLAPGRKLPPSNALGLFARHPALATAFLTFNKHLLGNSTLPARTRELAILRVAWRRRCKYEWVQHLLIARKAGVTDEEIARVQEGPSTLLSRAVDELEVNGQLSDPTYAELSAEFDDRQLMDLVFTIGAYDLLAKAFNTFEVELDPGFDQPDFDRPAQHTVPNREG
jgi:4-carboxymuconolactone decarboxylase